MYTKFLCRLEADLKKKRIKKKDISILFECTPANVTLIFKGKAAFHFSNFYKLAELLYEGEPDIFNRVMREFCILSDRPDNEPMILEYLMNNGYFELAEELAYKFDNPEFSPLYLLLMQRNRGAFVNKKQEMYRRTEQIKLNTNFTKETSKVMMEILTLYSFYDLNAWNVMLDLVDDVTELVLQLEDSYFKHSMLIRVWEMKSTVFMARNEKEKAREMAWTIINSGNIYHFPIISAYALLAQLHAEHDYEQSIQYIKKSLSLLEVVNKDFTIKRVQLEATHDFIRLIHNDFNELFLSDRAEVCHYHARLEGKENQDKCLSILNEIERKRGELTSFQLYYKGICLRNQALLKVAIEGFQTGGNLFYASLIRSLASDL
ncbi:AimR family lysis-lysogeny pheromone receptor [Bacillus salitolerans]|uniref:AimR family lysis-lysogeny pheromone receptor n=1 Tax=Bacillus salitolerans TaxID=1437434 RepID=A0ABW4LLZ6_9BACI